MSRHDPNLIEAFTANRAAIDRAVSSVDALELLQGEIVATAIRYRDARLCGIDLAARHHKGGLFALLRVRKAMRAAA